MSLSQYILDAREQYRLEIRERNTWLARLRWYYLAILATVTVIASTLAQDDSLRNSKLAVTIAGTGLVSNTIIWALTKLKNQRVVFYQGLAIAQLLLDIILAASVIYFQHGLSSRGTVLFTIPIVGAGLLFTRRITYVAAICSAVAYTSSLLLYAYNHPGSYAFRQAALPAIFYTAVFLIIATIISAYRTQTDSNQREKSYQELLSLLRHQLYHPASVVAAIVDMLEHSEHFKTWPNKDKVYLRQIKHENKRQNTMIANLLESVTDHSVGPGNTKVFDVVELLNQEATNSATGAKRLGDLQTRLPNEAIEVEGDPSQLSTAFDNIIENAFRYTEKGTPVIITAAQKNNRVTISVHDNGPGISKPQQRALFKLFSKMESRISGDPEKLYDSGLGLYVSKLIVERHKGTLELTSSEEYGTNITITLNRRLT